MSEILAQVPSPGGYFSIVKILTMLVLATPWLYLSPKIAHDVKNIRGSEVPWNASVLGVGGFGLLMWLVLPQFFIGLLAFTVLAYGTQLAYLFYRNGRVPAEQQITLGKLFSGSAKSTKAAPPVSSRVKIYSADGRIVNAPSQDAAESLIISHNVSQDLFYDALWRRASEIDVSPAGQQARVRFVIDGVATEGLPMDLASSELMIQYVKGIAGMDVEDRRRPQRGKLSVDLAGMAMQFMVASAGTTGGQRLQMRVRQEVVQTNIEQLGMSDDVLKRVRAIGSQGRGLIIVSGKKASGVTSTLYSLLGEQDAFIKQLYTVEARPDIDLENITQNTYGPDIKLPQLLASILRRDPDVLMVDQCPDSESARLISDCASQKVTLLGMDASDSFSALAKWVKVCGDTWAVDNLSAILCQVLVRKLCPTCREPYRPDPQILAKANLPSKGVEHFYRPPTQPLVDEKGKPYTCPTCQGSGYLGRTGAFELLEMTDELRELIRQGASLTQIKSACRKNRMLYLQEQALRKVMEGVTSIQEVVRVTQAQQAKQ